MRGMRSRTRILTATLDLIADSGFEGITIAAVAEKAHVSRQTVYSIFGTREDMVSQAFVELTLGMMDQLRERLSGMSTPADYVVELIVAGRAIARGDPTLSTLLHDQTANPLFDDGMMARALPVTREMLTPIADLEPSLADHMDDIAELTTLLAVSVVLFTEATRDDDDLRRLLHAWCDPALRAMVS